MTEETVKTSNSITRVKLFFVFFTSGLIIAEFSCGNFWRKDDSEEDKEAPGSNHEIEPHMPPATDPCFDPSKELRYPPVTPLEYWELLSTGPPASEVSAMHVELINKEVSTDVAANCRGVSRNVIYQENLALSPFGWNCNSAEDCEVFRQYEPLAKVLA